MCIAPHKDPGGVEDADDDVAKIDSSEDGSWSVGSADKAPGIDDPDKLPGVNHSPDGECPACWSYLKTDKDLVTLVILLVIKKVEVRQ